MKCSNCGEEVENGAFFCQKCGASLRESEEDRIDRLSSEFAEGWQKRTEGMDVIVKNPHSKLKVVKEGYDEALNYLKKWENKFSSIKSDFHRDALCGKINEFREVVMEGQQIWGQKLKENPEGTVGECRASDEGGNNEIARLSCPYCGFENFEVPFKKSEDEYSCPKCKKIFKAIIGVVRLKEGKFRTAGWGPNPYTIRLITKENREKAISFTTDWKFIANSGDYVGLIYKKAWLSKAYSPNPCAIINWTLGEYVKL